MIQGDFYTIDSNSRIVEFTFSDKHYSFPIGNLLIDFLNLDLSDYEKSRIKCKNFIQHPDSNEEPELTRDSNLFSANFYDEIRNNPKDDKVCFYLSMYFLFARKRLNHPFSFIDFYYIDYIQDFSSDELLNDKYNLLYLQTKLINLIDFCFNTDNNPKFDCLSPAQRLAIYCHTLDGDVFWLNSMNSLRTFELLPNSEKTNLNFYAKRNGNLYPRKLTNKFISDVKDINFLVKEVYRCYDIPTFLFIELMKLFEIGILIKKCKNCGKYFIPKGNYRTLYCDNIPPDKSRTCKQIGSSNTYNHNIKSNEIKRVYNRIYKKFYARINKANFSQKNFYSWSSKAKIVRDYALKNNLSAVEFKKIIDTPYISFHL